MAFGLLPKFNVVMKTKRIIFHILIVANLPRTANCAVQAPTQTLMGDPDALMTMGAEGGKEWR